MYTFAIIIGNLVVPLYVPKQELLLPQKSAALAITSLYQALSRYQWEMQATADR